MSTSAPPPPPPDAATLDAVRAGMAGLSPPGHYDRVYKDECMYSFDTPESPGGLYINLNTFQVPIGPPSSSAAAAAARPSSFPQKKPNHNLLGFAPLFPAAAAACGCPGLWQ